MPLENDQIIDEIDFYHQKPIDSQKIETDAFGVQRSDQPFRCKPQLFLDILSEIKPRWVRRHWKTSAQIAEYMLHHEDFNQLSDPLKDAWNLALTRTTGDELTKPLAERYKRVKQ